MAEKKVIVVVESTAAMGPYWGTLQMDYLNKIVRSLCANEPSVPNPEFALVTYNTHGCYSPILVQRSGCTRDPDVFLEWLSSITFSGGGFNDAAIAEGLAEALMMFLPSQSGSPNQEKVDMHCILVAASNPYPLKTPVYVPKQNESDTGNHLFDAEAVAKVFPQFSISLSVICPKQLIKIKAIYNAGKQNNRASDPPVDAKTTHLILISEGFREAYGALSRRSGTNLPSNQSHVKVEDVSVTQVTGAPPSSLSSVNGSIANRQPIHVGNVTPAIVSSGMTSFGPTGQNAFSSSFESLTASAQVGQNSNTSNRISQPLANLQEPVSMGQQVPGMNLGNLSGIQTVQGGVNMPLSQPVASSQSKCIKVWEGSLSAQRQGQSVFITKLEGFRSSSASETLAANWPPVMQIVGLISQDFINNQYVGKVDFLVFRAMNQHGFLGQLKEKKIYAVIQLSSQMLLLSVSDKPCRLIGMLFPRDMVVFKPPLSSQQRQQMQQQHQQKQSRQQQLPKKQEMVGAGIGQTYVQGHGRSQEISQEQVSSQGATNIGGINFMS